MRHILIPALFATLLSTTAIAAEKTAAPTPTMASDQLVEAMSGDYVLEKSHASVVFRINHMGYANYTGRFNTLDASLHFDAKDPSSSSVNVTVMPASVDTNNSTLEATLASKEWFNTTAFPKATFVSTKIEKTGAKTGKITGDFTLAGVTKPIVLDAVFNGGGHDAFMKKDKIGFSAKTTIKRSDFGVSNYVPLVGDSVAIDIEVEFVRKD
jgi:polyisoprenoid-binding protein YceI